MTSGKFPYALGRRVGIFAFATGVAALALRSAAAEDARPSPGFFFCAAPYVPRCIEKTAKPKASNVCEREMQVYIQSVFRYRECLAIEMERAVRESNEVIDAWKCRNTSSACRNPPPPP